MSDTVRDSIYQAIASIRLIDPHTHINPHAPASTTLADILGYHYFTELAHSAGMPKAAMLTHGETPPWNGSELAYQWVLAYWFDQGEPVLMDVDGNKIMEDARRLTFRADENARSIDVDLTLVATRDVTLDPAKDAGLSVRVAHSMSVAVTFAPPTCTFPSSAAIVTSPP